MLKPDRFFDPIPKQKEIAEDLYSSIQNLPIVSPHSHVDPSLFSQHKPKFTNPVALLVQPDHYIYRMLYSQGVPFEEIMTHEDPRTVWQLFGDNFYQFRGTPSGIWFSDMLATVFQIEEKLEGKNANSIYDQIAEKLKSESFSPRNLFQRLNIEVLATTDAATDTLEHHRIIREAYPEIKIIPTFRPDDLIKIQDPDWIYHINNLTMVSGIDVVDFKSFIQAIEQRRGYFKSLGATASDISPAQILTGWLSALEIESIFQRALKADCLPEDATLFSAHMLCELARMSVEDGLVMQIHPFVYRNHNPKVMLKFGADMGFDMPVRAEFTRNLHALLDSFGNNPALTIILFTLDESNYARELAPLAGAYPAIKIGPPWWFHDSWNGMRRYLDQVMDTAGLYNTVGFIDDTRVFHSIPARHDIWRRACANWLAGLLVRGMIDRADAESMLTDMVIGLAKKTYHL